MLRRVKGSRAAGGKRAYPPPTGAGGQGAARGSLGQGFPPGAATQSLQERLDSASSRFELTFQWRPRETSPPRALVTGFTLAKFPDKWHLSTTSFIFIIL